MKAEAGELTQTTQTGRPLPLRAERRGGGRPSFRPVVAGQNPVAGCREHPHSESPSPAVAIGLHSPPAPGRGTALPLRPTARPPPPLARLLCRPRPPLLLEFLYFGVISVSGRRAPA
jgi:hypothetical protein